MKEFSEKNIEAIEVLYYVYSVSNFEATWFQDEHGTSWVKFVNADSDQLIAIRSDKIERVTYRDKEDWSGPET